MKNKYETPHVEEVVLCTEQRILDVSLKVLMATEPADLDTRDMITNTSEDW